VRILVLLTDRPRGELVRRLLDAPPERQVTVIDLCREDVAYDHVVEAIAAHDRVISW
jgi:hypothetical protein